MLDKTEKDNQTLIGFWDKAFALSEEQQAEMRNQSPESWKELAPCEKLFRAAGSLGQKKKVLDYGCGDAWAGIIAAKNGCADVTAADAAPGRHVSLRKSVVSKNTFMLYAEPPTGCEAFHPARLTD